MPRGIAQNGLGSPFYLYPGNTTHTGFYMLVLRTVKGNLRHAFVNNRGIRGVAQLGERLFPAEQEVAGSIPAAPDFHPERMRSGFFPLTPVIHL